MIIGFWFFLDSCLSDSPNYSPKPFSYWLGLVFLGVLYPYSRWIYESAVNYVVGTNFFILPASILLFCKFFTMLLCFGLSPIIAPVGLLVLWIYHTLQEKKQQEALNTNSDNIPNNQGNNFIGS